MRRGMFNVCLLGGLVVAGCKATPSKTVVVYVPSKPMHQKPAPYTDVYELWRWSPAATKPAKAIHGQSDHTEIATAFVRRGTPVGFGRTDGHLVALAGGNAIPLDEGKYSWQTLPGETSHMEQQAVPPVAMSAGTAKPSTEEMIFDLLGDVVSASIDAALDDSDDDNDFGGASGGGRGKGGHHGGGGGSGHVVRDHRGPTSRPGR